MDLANIGEDIPDMPEKENEYGNLVPPHAATDEISNLYVKKEPVRQELRRGPDGKLKWETVPASSPMQGFVPTELK